MFLAVAVFLAAMLALRTWVFPDLDWGSAVVLDAVRLSRGLPVYEDWRTGHPTWLYGPGLIWILGAAFTIAPPSTWLATALSLLMSLGSVAICTRILRSQLSGRWLFLAATSFVLIQGQVFVFAAIGPDTFAMFFALAGLCLCYRGGAVSTILGGLLIVAATLTKQPFLAAAGVPVTAWALDGGRSGTRGLLVASVPLAMVAILFLVVRSHPIVWFYFVEVSAQYSDRINYRDFVIYVVSFVTTAAPLWVCAVLLASRGIEQPPAWWCLIRWTGSATVIATLVGSLAAAKFGGGVNSMLPAWFALVLLCWLLVVPVIAISAHSERGWLVQWGVLLAFFFMLLPKTAQVSWPVDFVLKGERSAYFAVRSQIRALPGTVMSPGNVMLTFLERGQLDRCVWLDADIFKWPANLPMWLLEAHYTADNFVINDPQQVGFLRLPERGYVQTWADGRYSIWTHKSAR